MVRAATAVRASARRSRGQPGGRAEQPLDPGERVRPARRPRAPGPRPHADRQDQVSPAAADPAADPAAGPAHGHLRR